MTEAQQTTVCRTTWLQRQADGSFVDWGRHGPGRQGAALWYRGEAAEVLRLVLAASDRPKGGGTYHHTLPLIRTETP